MKDVKELIKQTEDNLNYFKSINQTATQGKKFTIGIIVYILKNLLYHLKQLSIIGMIFLSFCCRGQTLTKNRTIILPDNIKDSLNKTIIIRKDVTPKVSWTLGKTPTKIIPLDETNFRYWQREVEIIYNENNFFSLLNVTRTDSVYFEDKVLHVIPVKYHLYIDGQYLEINSKNIKYSYD